MRKQNHIELLADYLQEARSKAFEWGRHDCATFAAGSVELITGRHIEFQDLRGVRSSEEVIVALRKQSLKERVTLILGPPISVGLAKRGDIVLEESESEREALGVCFGEFSFFLLPVGITPKPTLYCLRAWSVD